MIRFVVPKDKDLTELKKYGFVKEQKEWVIWENTRRITVIEKTRKVSFNMINNDIIAIIIEMAKDDWFKVIDYNPKTHHKHYIGLDDEEYKLIVDRRIANGEIDYYE